MAEELTRFDVWIAGILAALFAVAQAAVVVGMAVGFIAVLLGWRGDLPMNATAAMLCVIIAAGAYFPLIAYIGSLGEGAVNKSEGDRWARRFLRFGPVALFVFWWRCVRPRVRTG
jgi:hypothetical protein